MQKMNNYAENCINFVSTFKRPDGSNYRYSDLEYILSWYEGCGQVKTIISTIITIVFAAVAVIMMLSIDSVEHTIIVCLSAFVCMMTAVLFGLMTYLYGYEGR